jgi:hypothetical protein
MQFFFNQQHHFLNQIVRPGKLVTHNNGFGQIFMGVDKIAVAVLAEDKILVRLQLRQNPVTAGFVGNVFADQPHGGLGRFQFAYQMVSEQQGQVFRFTRLKDPGLRRAAEQKLMYRFK